MKSFLKKYGPAIVSGLLLGFSFPSWNLWPLAWVALVPLLVQTAGMSPRAAAGRFFLAGWVFNCIILQWLMTTMYWGGGWAFWGYQAVCVIMAAYWALLGLTWTWLHRAGTPVPSSDLPPSVPPHAGGRLGGGALGLAILFATMEYAQAHLFSGFGWGSLAYSQGSNLLALQWAAIGSGVLVSALIVLVNALLALALVQGGWRRYARIAGAVVVVLVVHVSGYLMLDKPDYDSKPFKVGLFQANYPLEMKHDPQYTVQMVQDAVDKSWAILEVDKVDLVVWPESLVMDDINKPDVLNPIAAFTTDTGVPVFTGTVRDHVQTGGEFNSSALIADGQVADYYDKVHLAPFGEYVPFSTYFPFIAKVVPAIGDIDAGSEHKVIAHNGRSIGPLICFEVLFTDIAEQLRDMGADYLVVVANLGWFGASNAIPQELEMARLRAIETRLPLINCANTGISGVFDPYGRFTMVRGVYGLSGRLFEPANDFGPKDTIMYRMGDALAVPAPVERPVANGPVIFSYTALAISALMIAYAALVTTRKPKTESSTPQPESDGND